MNNNAASDTGIAIPTVDSLSNSIENEHYFRLEGTHGDLRRRAISGGVITVVAQAVRFGLYFISTIVLSRLLSKEDFGLVAMVAVLTSFLRIFREAGLSTATVQHEGITHAQVSNLFWINLVLGIGAALAGAALSPTMAWFYHDPRLIPITILLSAGFIFSGSAVQHIAILNRQMRFKSIATIDIGSMTASLIVGTLMACSGWGYWSLVGSQLAASVTEFILAWTVSSWRPQMPKSGVGTRSMVNFGASLTYATMLRRITSQLDTVLIGRLLGAAPLGLYTRAMALLMRPLDQFVTPFDTVFVPLLSRLQTDSARYRKTFLQVNHAISMVSFPAAGMLLALSDPLITLLLGPKWREVIPIFAALAIAAMYYPIACIGMWLPTTQGRKNDIVLLGTVISTISVVSFIAGIYFGVTGVALGFSLSGLLIRLPFQYYVIGRRGPVTRSDLWRQFFANLPLWVIVCVATYFGMRLAPSSSAFAGLVYGAVFGMGTTALLIVLIPFHRHVATELLFIGRDFISRHRARDAAA